MPEIWLSYGPTDIVLDIKAENLDKKIESGGTNLTDLEISSKLEQIDLTKPTELVILEYSKSVQKVISIILEKCNQKSIPKPKILVDKSNFHVLKNIFSDPTLIISEFDMSQLSNSNLIFIGEIEFDGLFGFNTISTKLVKRFGKDHMLAAYEKRKGDLPFPGEDLQTFTVAQKFTESSDQTFGRSLSSLWNCSEAIKEEGLAILLAECRNGIGSEAIQQYVEGRMSLDRLKSPAKYVDGMEDLLFLTEIGKKFQIGIVSILPEFYTKKLEMLSFGGIKYAMDHILKIQGARQKISIVSDGSHVLLR